MIAAVKRLAVGDEFLDIALRLRILSTQGPFAHNVIKQRAWHDEGRADFVEILVATVTCNQPIIRIEHDETVRHGFKSVFKGASRGGALIFHALPLPQPNHQGACHK